MKTMKTIKNWKSFVESVDVVKTSTKLNTKEKEATEEVKDDFKKVATTLKTSKTKEQLDACEKLIINFINKYQNHNNKDWITQTYIEINTNCVKRANELMSDLQKKRKELEKETKK